jgi:phosphate starvation-inducible membrane PsiE
MLKSILRFIKRAATNRLGQLLIIIHLILVVYDFARKRPLSVGCDFKEGEWDFSVIADRIVHFHYESVILKIIFVLDLPALFLSVVFTPLRYFLYPHICAYSQSWIEAGILLTCASIQWLLVGYFLTWLFRSLRSAYK